MIGTPRGKTWAIGFSECSDEGIAVLRLILPFSSRYLTTGIAIRRYVKARVRRLVVSEPQRLSCQPFRWRAPARLWLHQNAASNI
jgi:hypothetical protein